MDQGKSFSVDIIIDHLLNTNVVQRNKYARLRSITAGINNV